MARLQLSLAFADNPRSRPVLDGRITAEGIDFVHTRSGMQELAWRQLHGHEFQVSELSMSSLIAARSRGDASFVGVPIFTTRSFMQTAVVVRADAGINEPADLVGKRIGVPEYQQTAALWARGILHHEFGVDPQDCHWYMERIPEQSHGGATGFQPPPSLDFHYIPPESSIAAMLVAGELDASLLGTGLGVDNAGFSALPPQYAARPVIVNEIRPAPAGAELHVRRLFPDPRAEATRYFQKTGIYPINHGVCVRKDVVDKYPWVPLNIYQAFLEAKDMFAAEVESGLTPFLDTGLLSPEAGEVLKADLFPYGVQANRNVLETLVEYSYEQGLSARRVALEEIFYEPTLKL